MEWFSEDKVNCQIELDENMFLSHRIPLHFFSLCELHCQSLACHCALQSRAEFFNLSSKVEKNRLFTKANAPFLEPIPTVARPTATSCVQEAVWFTDSLENQAWIKWHSLPVGRSREIQLPHKISLSVPVWLSFQQANGCLMATYSVYPFTMLRFFIVTQPLCAASKFDINMKYEKSI